MLSFTQRAEILAEVGPAFAHALTDTTTERWTFIAGTEADKAILVRDDGLRLSMLPGWCEHAQRFELSALARVAGRLDPPARHGLPAGTPPLRIQVTMRADLNRMAREVVQRLVEPFEPIFRAIGTRQSDGAREAQRLVAQQIAQLTGARQQVDGEDIALAVAVGGVSLPLRVSPNGGIELGRTTVSDRQLAAIVAGLEKAETLRPHAVAGRV